MRVAGATALVICLPTMSGRVRDPLLVALQRLDNITRRPHPEREHSDPEVCGKVERRRLRACHPDRGVRVLDRLRYDRPFGHREVLALESRVRVLGPHTDDLGQHLFEHRPRVLGVDAEPAELGFGDRTADSEVVPTLAHDVEHRRHLR